MQSLMITIISDEVCSACRTNELMEGSVQGVQTDLKSVAVREERSGVRFLYLPPSCM